MEMCDHCHSSSFLVVELATDVAVIVFVAVVFSEGHVVRMFVGIVVLAFIFSSG